MDKKRMEKKKKKRNRLIARLQLTKDDKIVERDTIKRNNTQIIITYYEFTKCDYSKRPNLSVKYNNTKIELIKLS